MHYIEIEFFVGVRRHSAVEAGLRVFGGLEERYIISLPYQLPACRGLLVPGGEKNVLSLKVESDRLQLWS